MASSGIYPGERTQHGLYTVLNRARQYGLGCDKCRGIIVGPSDQHDGADTRLRWKRRDWPEGHGWDYLPCCPSCSADLDFIGVEDDD